MCRMIGVAAVQPVNAAPFLAALSDLSRNGDLVEGWERRPGGNHPDGWGVAWREAGGFRILRGGTPANADPNYSEVRVTTDRFIGHVRNASNLATVNAENAHPFLLSGAILAHNGTFRGRIGEEAASRRVSDTVVFLELLTDRWGERTFSRLREALEGILGDGSLVGNYSAANLLIASGESLFALRNFRRDEAYYTLYLKAEAGLAVAASQALDDDPGWRLLDNGELVELHPVAPRSQPVFAAA